MSAEVEASLAIVGERVDPSGVDWAGADFVWRSPLVRIAAFGAAAIIEASGDESLAGRVHAVLADLVADGASPIAVGALPFDPRAPRRLVIPSVVYRRFPDGTTTCTRIDGLGVEFPRDEVPSNIESHDETGYKQMVTNAIEVLDEHSMRKMAIARRYELISEQPLDRAAVVRALADRAQRSFLYADGNFVGATPELLVRRMGNSAWSEPMAGTMPLGDGLSNDALAAKLFTKQKRYEHEPTPTHVASVLAQVGEVTVHDTEVREFPTLAHLVTRVEAENTAGLPDAMQLVEMLHPTPAVGAAPAGESNRVRQIEGFDRRRYAGPVGWVDAAGNGEWAIALRCGEIGEHHALLTAGNGITAMSEPHEEWLETESKLAVMIDAIDSSGRV